MNDVRTTPKNDKERLNSEKKLRIALLVFKEKIAQTVFDHINSFVDFSKNIVEVHDLSSPHNINLKQIMEADVLVLHYTISVFSDYRLPIYLRFLIKNFLNPKVLFIQDEYRLINKVHDALNYLKIDILFTCVPTSEIEKVYPTDKLPYLKKKINVLTGYVPEQLTELFHSRPNYEERNFDVVYRARKLSSWFGKLGLEKWQIVEKFMKNADDHNLNVDLSYSESDRIYGKDWVSFLQNSRASLGVESGSSVFDFTGEIQKNVEEHEKKFPDTDFADLERLYFAGLDGQIYLNQISPRCFECAALGTLMILYEGNYSGVLKPWRHYVPLKKDHSNINEVINALQNKKIWEEITLNAYTEVALNEQYSYQAMVKTFDDAIEDMRSSIQKISFAPKHYPDRFRIYFLFRYLRTLINKYKILYILRLMQRGAHKFCYTLYSNIYSLRNLTNLAINNNTYLQPLELLKAVYILKMFSKQKCNIMILMSEILIFDKLHMRYMKGSPFSIKILDEEVIISFQVNNYNDKKFIDRFLEIKQKIKKVEKVTIDFPESFWLSESLSGLRIEMFNRRYT